MKRFTYLVILFLLLPCLILTAVAQDNAVIADMENILTQQELQDLTQASLQLEDTYGVEILLVTAPSFSGQSARDYADDYMDRHGDSADCILFLLSMAERQWYISTAGTAIDIFTDHGLDVLGQAAADYFAQDRCYEGFSLFLSMLPDYFEAYAQGEPIDHSGSPGRKSFGRILLTSLLIGIVTAGATILVLRFSMNTKRRQRSAADYMVQGSYHLHTHRDLFLYSNVTKTRRQQNSGGKGGSTTHRSSSGRTHGGRGGKF